MSLKRAESLSFFIACALGVLFHFIYEWTGESPIAALFFPINESTWEHLKLIYFPIALLSVIEYFFLGIRYNNFIVIKFLSILLGMGLSIVSFYTYTGIYGKSSDVMNILIYLVSMAAAYWFSYRMIRGKKLMGIPPKAGYWGFVALMLLFFLFSLFPPTIGLFQPPLS